ncbi:MAG: sialidase family protein, partial [Polyangiaceae bacterium]
SPDHGCGWSFAGGDLAGKLFNDVTIHAEDPAHVLALVSKFAATTDAGITYTNLIYESHDNGATWSAVGGALDPTIIAETIDTAKSDPNRLYVSGIRGQGTNAVGVFLASTDAGKTFTESTITLVSTDEHAPYIGAVDPTNPDRIYVRIAGSTAGRLLASSDGGKTFTPVFSGPPLFGFAVSPDGAKVFVGASNGLFEASSADLAFAQKSSIQVQCLATSGTRLYACSVESSGFVVGASDDDGSTFTPLLHLDSLRGPLACPSGSTGSICLPDWPATAANLGVNIDGGSVDAGSTLPTPSSQSSGCSCNVPEAKNAGLGAAVTLFVTALTSLLIRRKKKV